VHDVLGTFIGETLGYTLTALWTILVIVAFASGPAWFRVWGAISAALILSGVLIPLDVPGVDERTSSATCCGACGSSPSPLCWSGVDSRSTGPPPQPHD
jgi:hypothetical protein